MRYLKFILSVIMVLFIVVILVENHEALSNTVHFKFDMFTLHYQTVEISMYYMAAIPFLLGVLITWIYGIVERYQLKRQIKGFYKILKDKDKELNSLRNLPITSDHVVSGNIDDMMK